MLRIILLSLAWAICSTCLVRPWFWKGVKKKYLFNDRGVRIGFDNMNWESNLIIEIICFVVVFTLSLLLYTLGGFRQNIYGSFIMIMLCFLAQCLWKYQGKVRYSIMLAVVAICAILGIQDICVGDYFSVPLNRVDKVQLTAVNTQEQDNSVKLFVSTSEIESLFKVSSATGPTYNNGKYIFIVHGGDNKQGVVIIDKDDPTEANFISCSYDLIVKDIRLEYPTQKLKALYVAISDDNIPYGVFATADKSWILGTYDVNSYVLLNLLTGETQEFIEEELPAFVTNN